MYSNTKIHTDRIWEVMIYPPRGGKLMCSVRMDNKSYLGFINNPDHIPLLTNSTWYHRIVQFKLTKLGYLDIESLIDLNIVK